MATLVEALAIAGSRKPDGTANSSGRVWAYIPGTSAEVPIYPDTEATAPLPQPVTLDAAGKASVYLLVPATLHIETAAGIQVSDIDFTIAASSIEVTNPGFSGTRPDGSYGPGGVTTLDAVLSAAVVSFGAPDFRYAASLGNTNRPVGEWMRDAWISVKDTGAVGDGLADDSQACQSAIYLAIQRGGGTVYIPPHTRCLISFTLRNDSSAPVSIVGSGGSSVLVNNNPGAGVIYFAQPGQLPGGFQLRDFNIEHISGTASAAITIATNKVSVVNVGVSGHTIGVDFPLTQQYTDLDGLIIAGVDNAAFRGIRFQSSSPSCSISRCRIATSGAGVRAGIGIACGPGAYNGFSISRCTIDTGTGVQLDSVTSGPGGANFAPMAIFANHFPGGAGTIPIAVVNFPVATYRQWANGIEGYTQAIVANSTVTPDWTRGEDIRYDCTGAGVTVVVAAPVPFGATPVRGALLRLRLYNHNAGVTTWTLDAAYHKSALVPTTAALIIELTFAYDIDVGCWNEVGRSTHS